MYKDDGDTVRTVVSLVGANFMQPTGGWEKKGRNYSVLKEKKNTEKVKDLLMAIREKSRGNSEKTSPKKTAKPVIKEKPTVRKRSFRLRLGWKHWRQTKYSTQYKQVFFKDGGGVREVNVESLDIDVETILNTASQLFFPSGVSKLGKLEAMECSLGDFSGEKIDKFVNSEGEPCPYGEYLKAVGVYPSKCTMFLMTKSRNESQNSSNFIEDEEDDTAKENSNEGSSSDCGEMLDLADRSSTEHSDDTEQNVFKGLVGPETEPTMDTSSSDIKGAATAMPDEHRLDCALDSGSSYTGHMSRSMDTLGTSSVSSNLYPLAKGKICTQNKLDVTYTSTKQSLYTDKTISMNCFSRKSCKEFSEIDDLELKDQDIEQYDPLMHGFHVTHLQIGNKIYLETCFNEDGVRLSRYPSAGSSGHNDLIIHQPSEICGYDSNELIIGIVTNTHESEEVIYAWHKDDQIIQEGPHLAVVSVSSPGIYHCRVTMNDLVDVSEPIQIVQIDPTTKAKLQVGANIAGASSELSMSIGIPEIDRGDIHFDTANEVGRGSFGVVYIGQWAGSTVAVKYVQLKRMRNQIQKIVKNEIQVNERIRHPNVVQLMGVSYHVSGIYLVSEYIDGHNMEDCTFDDAVKLKMQITRNNKMSIAKQCLKGLAYLHALKPTIVHQDVKPANVMIAKGTFCTKICDMGMAKVKSLKTCTSNTLIGNGPAGTPSYMAPECILHGGKATAASDIWSVGVTLTEFLTEQDAWEIDGDSVEEEDPIQLMFELMKRKKKPSMVYSVPSQFIILAQCVEYEPSLRPTAIQILLALQG